MLDDLFRLLSNAAYRIRICRAIRHHVSARVDHIRHGFNDGCNDVRNGIDNCLCSFLNPPCGLPPKQQFALSDVLRRRRGRVSELHVLLPVRGVRLRRRSWLWPVHDNHVAIPNKLRRLVRVHRQPRAFDGVHHVEQLAAHTGHLGDVFLVGAA